MTESPLPDLPRWWMELRDDAHRPIDEHGFLVDAETAAWLHRGLRCLQLGDLVDVPCLMLLGEAGAGKTHALERAPVRRGTHVLPVVALRDIGPRASTGGERHLTDIFESEIAWAWRKGRGDLVVRLDGLDECGLTPDRALGLLKEALEVNDLTRLQLRLTSRPASWRVEGKEVMQQLSGRRDDGRGDEVRVLELLPLRRDDVLRAIDERGIAGPLDRLDEILRLGLGPLASQPDTLRFLLDEMAEGRPLTERSQVALRRSAIERALSDARPAAERQLHRPNGDNYIAPFG